MRADLQPEGLGQEVVQLLEVSLLGACGGGGTAGTTHVPNSPESDILRIRRLQFRLDFGFRLLDFGSLDFGSLDFGASTE